MRYFSQLYHSCRQAIMDRWQQWRTPTDVLRWRRHAALLPRYTFIQWLADEIAFELVINKPHNVTVDELLYSVTEGSSCGSQPQAEWFIAHYYDLFLYEHDGKYCRIVQIFRHAVQRSIKRDQLLAKAVNNGQHHQIGA